MRKAFLDLPWQEVRQDAKLPAEDGELLERSEGRLLKERGMRRQARSGQSAPSCYSNGRSDWIRPGGPNTEFLTLPRRLHTLARSLEREHPGAAASVREGLEETLTVVRLAVSGALQRTLRSTNAIENLNGLVEHYTRKAKRRRSGEMRWVGAALLEQRFRRIRGHMPRLLHSLQARARDSNPVSKVE